MRDTGSENGRKTTAEVAFAIQGGLNAARNHTRIIAYLDDLVQTNPTSHVRNDVALHVIGSGSEEGRPIVSASVSNHIFFERDLDYIDYYATMSKSSALIPAFAEEDFFHVKSSSSVPASVIAGIPLVATRAALQSYSYLIAEGVYLQEDYETESGVIKRVEQGSKEERKAKIKTVGSLRDRTIENNINQIRKWIEEVTERLGR